MDDGFCIIAINLESKPSDGALARQFFEIVLKVFFKHLLVAVSTQVQLECLICGLLSDAHIDVARERNANV
jgi:hypothetical protein